MALTLEQELGIQKIFTNQVKYVREGVLSWHKISKNLGDTMTVKDEIDVQRPFYGQI